MRIFWLPFLLALGVNILLDFFIYRQLKKSSLPAASHLNKLHLVLAAVAHIAIIVTLLLPLSNNDTPNATFVNSMKVIWYYFMFYVSKLVWAIIHAFALPRWWPAWLKKGLKALALLVALLVMGVMLQGVRSTPYTYNITQATIESKRVPKAFDGYRIAHFSDLHLGTYNGDTTFVKSCVQAINQLKPDLIVFTGDLVSRTTSEAEPFKDVLSQLKATDGVLSILGNHDYDDYTTMTANQRKKDHDALCKLQTDCGWILLNNASTTLQRDVDSILVVGTENYSMKHTPNYSQFDNTMSGATHDVFTILLQHNPQMWRKEVVGGKYPVDLTLSGHTHAMQMVIRLFGKTYSPAQHIYREWGGLYTEGQQHLYVNTGIGMVGIPARIGVKPEITLITLKAKE